MKLIHVVADYAAGDLAFTELFSAIAYHLEENFILHDTPVPSFDTVATGFCVSQIGLQQKDLRAKETILFANCAPRRDRREERKNNDGEGILYGLLTNDVPVLIVNSGYSLSFIRENLKELWSVNVPSEGSQFRSRDIFPKIVGMLANKDLSFCQDRLDPMEVIPEPPVGVIAYKDSFGNLKTTYREGQPEISKLEPGQEIRLKIKDTTHTAKVASGSFNVKEGEIAFAPGSSGHDRRFWEVFKRGGSAFETFHQPEGETTVEIIL